MYNWNPPVRDLLQATYTDDVDDQVESDDNTDTDNDKDKYTADVTVRSKGPIAPAAGNSRVFSGLSLTDANKHVTSSGNSQNLPQPNHTSTDNLMKGAAKFVELTLDLFDNNFKHYAQKINHQDDGLFIRVILMKNNNILFNNTFKINGTTNAAIATIASADQVCNQYMVHARKGDSFICALGDGHHGVRNPIIRNEHLANFINTLNLIKVKIGLYTIVTGLKSDWLQYASHNSIYQELSLAPDKKNHHSNHWIIFKWKMVQIMGWPSWSCSNQILATKARPFFSNKVASNV